jgi:predicted acylesterase/phospholipase RssA
MVFSGGGARGVAYSGSYRALVETGVHNSTQYVSGASAGSLAGALMACGMTMPQFRRLFNETNLKDMLGIPVSNTDKPGIHFFTKDGSLLLQTLRYHIRSSLLQFVNEHLDERQEGDNLDAVLAKLSELESRITFSDLAILHQKWPGTFKKFTTLALEHPSGTPQIFDAERTPDVEIALACRASASLPIILEPVAIRVDSNEVTPRYFVDAGLYENIPTNYFDHDGESYLPNTKKEQTLVFVFGEDGIDHVNPVYEALYGSRIDELLPEQPKPRLYNVRTMDKITCEQLVNYLGGLQPDYSSTEQAEISYHNLRTNYPLRTIELRVDFVSSTEFDKASKLSRIAEMVGYFDTMNHIINHNLYDSDFLNPDVFYHETLNYFLPIYQAVLQGSNNEVSTTSLSQKMNQLKTTLEQASCHPSVIERELVYLIQEFTRKDVQSVEAFALSRAMEFRSKLIDCNQLLREIYLEAFQHSSFFARSKISGKTTRSHSDLSKTLAGKNMFHLFHQAPPTGSSRNEKILTSLWQLPDFTMDDSVPEITLPIS